MTLQEIIRRAITNPEFRLALETGAVDPLEIGCTNHQVQAAATALRFNSNAARNGQRETHLLGGLLDNNVFTLPGWRKDPVIAG